MKQTKKMQPTNEQIIIVDENDNQIGTGEKLQVHIDGKMHRAFSIFVYNSKGQLMLQKRDKNKYHSGGLWTNTTCSHPNDGENTEDAAHRRIKEEMGFDCPLKKLFSFNYKVEFDNGLIENECDHVFIGNYDKKPKPNPKEAEDWKWISMEDLEKEIDDKPEEFSHWIKIALPKIKEYL